MRLDGDVSPLIVRPGDTLVVGLRDTAHASQGQYRATEDYLPGVKVLVVRADYLAVFRPCDQEGVVNMPSDETTELLSTDLYEQAFTKAIAGWESVWNSTLSAEERDVIRRAMELTGTAGPGYPMPKRLDPTRNRTE